jgi:hypothetical protein
MTGMEHHATAGHAIVAEGPQPDSDVIVAEGPQTDSVVERQRLLLYAAAAAASDSRQQQQLAEQQPQHPPPPHSSPAFSPPQSPIPGLRAIDQRAPIPKDSRKPVPDLVIGTYGAEWDESTQT